MLQSKISTNVRVSGYKSHAPILLAIPTSLCATLAYNNPFRGAKRWSEHLFHDYCPTYKAQAVQCVDDNSHYWDQFRR